MKIDLLIVDDHPRFTQITSYLCGSTTFAQIRAPSLTPDGCRFATRTSISEASVLVEVNADHLAGSRRRSLRAAVGIEHSA
jgi:hypothetical protein